MVLRRHDAELLCGVAHHTLSSVVFGKQHEQALHRRSGLGLGVEQPHGAAHSMSCLASRDKDTCLRCQSNDSHAHAREFLSHKVA